MVAHCRDGGHIACRMAKKKAPSPRVTAAAPPPERPFYRPFDGLAPSPKKKGGAKAPLAPPSSSTLPVKPSTSTKVKPTSSAKHSTGTSTGESFASLMYGVERLDGQKALRIPRTHAELPGVSSKGPSSMEQQRKLEDEDAMARLRALVAPTRAETFELFDDGEYMLGRRLDVDKLVFRRLRRGEFPIDHSLDLHSCSVMEARERVETTVLRHSELGDRTLLIIHGKGLHSPGGGVLRGELAAWLSQGRASIHVDAFASATQAEGGPGATYVLLRRSPPGKS